MSDVLFDVPAKQYKIRARIIQAINDGLELSQKQAQFFIGAYNYDPKTGAISASPRAEVSYTYGVQELLADPDEEVAKLAAKSLSALEQIGVKMCRRHADEVMQKITQTTASGQEVSP